MKFIPKISGTRVEDFNIEPIFGSEIVWLSEVMKVIKKQKTMNYILDTFRFAKGYEEKDGDWGAIIGHDTNLKISVIENYPEYEKEFIEYFGENWMEQYIRFNH